MLKDNFKNKYPDEYKKLGLYNYIQSNYNYYNIDRIELCALTIIYNIHLRKISDSRKKHEKENDERYILVHQNSNMYPFKKFSYHEIIHSLKVLKSLNIITEDTGYRNYYAKINDIWRYNDSMLTRLFLKPVDEWKIEKLNLTWFEFSQILYNYKNDALAKTRIKTKIKNKTINTDTTIDVNYINQDLNYINDFLNKKGYEHLQYSRIFGTDINSYGRFYNSFQSIPKTVRKKILKEKEWSELDYTSCIINIFHILETGKFYEGDIYNEILNKMGLPDIFRSVLKACFIIAVNTKNKKDAIKSIRLELLSKGLYSKYNPIDFVYIEKNAVHSRLDYTFNIFNFYFKDSDKFYLFKPEYILSLLEEYDFLKKYLYANSSSFTQNIESNTINKILLYMIKDKILPISIHDCIIISNKYKSSYKSLMNDLLLEECYLYKNKLSYYNSNYLLKKKIFNSKKYIYINNNRKKNNIFKDLFFKSIRMIEIWKNEYG